MIIKLLPTQIPIFWETIKYAVVQVDEIEQKYQTSHLNRILHSLLNDKSQCFVRLSPTKQLLSIMIAMISLNKMTDAKTLTIQALYSWRLVSDTEWQKDWVFVREFAQKEKCTRISFESKSPRIWQLGESVGFKEQMRTFSFDMEVR
jgi:hypothetical protein